MDPNHNRLYLYSQPTERLWADGEHPPVRVDLLQRLDLHGAAVLAAIAFALSEQPHFRWDGARGWLELPQTLMPAIFSDAQDFLSAVPSIQAWLHEWSQSAARAPDLSPDWAAVRKAGPAAVNEFSKSIASQLSKATRRCIALCDYNGAETALNVPARATLSLPPMVSNDNSVLHIARKERTLKLALATGREVLMPAGALSPTIAIGSSPLLVDPRRLRKKPVTHVKRVRSLPTGLPDEDIV